MLSGTHFYHRTSRKLIVAFGSIFNNIRLVRYNNEGTIEIERVNVPISYSSKEKFYKRITEDPTLANATQINLPRLAFEMTGMTYDPLRKISNHNDIFYGTSASAVSRVKIAPYNFDFNLHLFVRNIEEGYQIVEQILPYFTPDYTITMDFLTNDKLNLDVPIVFNGITNDIEQVDGGSDTTRIITWTLNFTMKGYIVGPTKETDIITDVRGNVYALSSNIFEMNSGNGIDYKLYELVYQGRSVDESTGVGYVHQWSNTTNTITLFDVDGRFAANSDIVGYISGAKYNLSVLPTSSQLLQIRVQPDPLSANITDDFAYTTTINRGPF